MKLKIAISTTLLYIVLIGLYLYHSILLGDMKLSQSNLNLNEFMVVDQALNTEFYKLKTNIFSDQKSFNDEWEHFATQKDIIISILKLSKEQTQVLKNFEDYVAIKKAARESILKSRSILQKNLNDLNPQVDSLAKLNIKFAVDRKDFYKELALNAFYFVLTPNPTNTARILEDKKILHQILTYSTITNPNILKLKELHDGIFESTQTIDANFKIIENNSFEKELSLMSLEFQKAQKARDELKDRFFLISVITMSLYLVVLYFLLKRI